MLTEQLAKELNQQINREFQSAYLYFSMAAFCKSRSMDGFEHWMLLQAQEEIAHGMKIYRYMNDRNAPVTALAMAQPQTDFNSMKQIFEVALHNEEDLDRRLNKLASQALDAKDNTTYQFLKWFLDEQVEEVATCTGILDKLTLIGDNGYGILMLNEEMMKRQPAPETGGEAGE
jgi:ferritin